MPHKPGLSLYNFTTPTTNLALSLHISLMSAKSRSTFGRSACRCSQTEYGRDSQNSRYRRESRALCSRKVFSSDSQSVLSSLEIRINSLAASCVDEDDFSVSSISRVTKS